MSPNTNVLIVAEDAALYDVIKSSPISIRSNISYCRATDDVLSFVKDNSIHVVITDVESNDYQRMSLLGKVKQYDPLIDVIIVGDPASSDDFISFVKQGSAGYLTRPLEVSALMEFFRKIEERKTLRKETYRLENRLDKHYLYRGMVGKSPFMLDIFNLIDIIAINFSIVLITGETGTGKELVARAIHEASPLSDDKLVICNCAAIPEHLFESELFGYVKGAFTGADRDKKGIFEEANKRTIFMDEIGEMPLATQPKLLRVLEYGHFRPLGSNEDKMVDIRVIASTNRNLRECMKNGTFREDLFFRLNKIEITIPPLRRRQEDIPLLVRHFLEQYRKKFSKKIMGVSRRLQKFFLKYPWPGNVRELENVLENSFITTKKEFIDIPDTPQYLRKLMPTVDRMPFISKEDLVSLEELEKSYLSYLLKITDGNLRKTARILGISRTTLYSKLTKYNIQR